MFSKTMGIRAPRRTMPHWSPRGGEISQSGNTTLVTMPLAVMFTDALVSLTVRFGCRFSLFSALEHFDCPANKLTSLDVSKNTALIRFWCWENQLTALDVSGCTALLELFCSFNQLKELDVSGCPALTGLFCGYNQLTSLDVSANTALNDFRCVNDQLESLDVSKNTALTVLWCNGNQLKSLNVFPNMQTKQFSCQNNNLKFSDLPLEAPISTYAPQNAVAIASSLENGHTLDLSSEYLIDGQKTQYRWRYADDTVVDSSCYTETDGKFVFTGLKDGDVVYCRMTNGKFPGLTLKTTAVTISVPMR